MNIKPNISQFQINNQKVFPLARVEDKILEKHFESCVSAAIQGKSATDKKRKLAEVLQLIRKFRKV